eukprot:1349676-Rhodomonas_salina.3
MRVPGRQRSTREWGLQQEIRSRTVLRPPDCYLLRTRYALSGADVGMPLLGARSISTDRR